MQKTSYLRKWNKYCDPTSCQRWPHVGPMVTFTWATYVGPMYPDIGGPCWANMGHMKNAIWVGIGLNFSNKPKSGQPTVATKKKRQQSCISPLKREDPHVTNSKLQHTLRISSGTINTILHNHLRNIKSHNLGALQVKIPKVQCYKVTAYQIRPAQNLIKFSKN